MRIVASSSYLPSKKVLNEEIEKKLNLETNYIEKRTGIKQRYFVQNETIEEMSIKAIEKLINATKIDVQEIDMIIVATTTTNNLMPGISNYIQKYFDIKKCISFDILAGCNGYINALDIAQMYIKSGKVNKGIVVGVDILSKYTDEKDVGTAIILADGAGATLIEKSENEYFSNIEAIPDKDDILTIKKEEKISMDGISVYKYAVTETVKNINQLLEIANEKIENIKYVVPHQSNLKIIKAISNRLGTEKMYTNIQNVGNTFCASIPIVLEEMQKKNLLKTGEKIILLGYGGGLNTGSILLEI